MVSTMKIVDTKKRASKPEFVNGIRVNRTGRRTYTTDFKLAVVRQCGEPGVSVAAIAMAHRINANLVRRWLVGHRRKQRHPVSKETATLLPVSFESMRESPTAVAQDETGGTTKRGGVSPALIEIELYGARIRLRGAVDVAALRSVLDVLAQR
jgi:transposase